VGSKSGPERKKRKEKKRKNSQQNSGKGMGWYRSHALAVDLCF
jgi:hypothetical protein